MLPLKYDLAANQSLNILCIGAHSDDIEIGCGGTILQLLADYPATITWIVLGASGLRRVEAENSAADFLNDAEKSKVMISEYRNSFFPYQGQEIKEYFELIKEQCKPDVIFTHHRNDLHQDHRLVSELTWNAFRNHNIFEYEIAKYDGDLASPNAFFQLDKDRCQKKIDLIMKHFRSQQKRTWFTAETFWAMLRIRGIQCNSSSGLAESHYSRKQIIL